MSGFAPGALVSARGREWVVLPDSDDELLVLRPLGGGDDDTAAVLPALEAVTSAQFPPPGPADLGDAASGRLLRTALRTGFRSSGGPFRALAKLAVEPRAYQYVPLLVALRQDPVRLLIADDVGIGKTVEAGLIAAELIAQGDVRRLAVLCSPALAEQWQRELHDKFALDAEVVLPSTAARLSRGLMLDESLFDRHPYVVISTDFIKSVARRTEFLNHCPELVIVDEAHGAVADSAATGTRTQRYDLMRRIAADRGRHLILVTATPHSGKEEGFRNLLGLLEPDLAAIDLDMVRGRERLARHFVQRRRGDIRRYVDEETAFPSDRETREAPYGLSPEYAAFFERVLDYARGRVDDDGDGRAHPVRQRVRWWSALALLRALASSPVAAAATLRTRASAAAATSVDEADALGRAAVLDTGDDDTLEGIDTTPGADTTPGPDTAPDTGPGSDTTRGAKTGGPDIGRAGDRGRPRPTQRRRLLDLARTAETLAGPKSDRKLGVLIAEVKALLADGFDPIVFCRFIDTADYVADHLSVAVGQAATVAAVTGTLPPALREARIAELVAVSGRHVLVATDCLSEGVNLQDSFDAVVHYDLAWNPTRHEQREGRVDRFGQRRDVVRAVTVYGRDNRIDQIVLDVLLRKSKAIRDATGVSVPVPDDADNVVEALVEGLILRRDAADQMTLDLGLDTRRAGLHRAWESAAEREHASRTKYAQEGIHPEEVTREVAAARAALGTDAEVERFTLEVLAALGTSVTAAANSAKTNAASTSTSARTATAATLKASPASGAARSASGGVSRRAWQTPTAPLPIGLRDSLPVGHSEPLVFHRDLPVPRDHAVLARTDPSVEAIARYVLDTALDPSLGMRIASRAGVARTRAVKRRTTLLLLRFRLHLDLPGRFPERGGGARQLVAEEARFDAFAGSPEAPEWLDADTVDGLLEADPDANVDAHHAVALLERLAGATAGWDDHLGAVADRLAVELADAHRRVRASAGAPRRGLSVTAQKPVDVLGAYVFLPIAVT